MLDLIHSVLKEKNKQKKRSTLRFTKLLSKLHPSSQQFSSDVESLLHTNSCKNNSDVCINMKYLSTKESVLTESSWIRNTLCIHCLTVTCHHVRNPMNTRMSVKYYKISYKIKFIISASSYKNVAELRLYSVKFTY